MDGWWGTTEQRTVTAWAVVVGGLLALMTPPGAVYAQEVTVVLLDMPGRGGQANTRALRTQLEKEGNLVLYDQAWFFKRAQERAVSVEDILDLPDSLVAVSDREGPDDVRVDAVIGPVSSTRTALMVEVYNASLGTPVGTVTFPARNGRIVARNIPEVLPELQSLISLTGWAGADMTFEPEIAEPALTPVIDDELVDEPELPNTGPTGDEAWILAHAGMTLAKRDFSLGSSTEELEYSSSFYPGVSVAGEAYPLMLISSGDDPWASLGVTAHFMRAFDDATIDEGSGPRSVPVTHQDFGF
ncbi:MAG: hypothetical protein AAFS10_22755, partial [Myxococcota bacterium]